MRGFSISTILLLLVCCCDAIAADCDSYTGTRVDATSEITGPVGKALTAIKTRNTKALFAISSSKLLLLRRSVTGGADGRTGNIRLALRPRDIDANLNIHIGDQTFTELGAPALFDAANAASTVTVRREVCEGARRCEDALPASEEVPFLMKDLLQCNRGATGVFAFSDGVFVTDMQAAEGKLPVGSALFFAKEPGGYRLAGVIIQR